MTLLCRMGAPSPLHASPCCPRLPPSSPPSPPPHTHTHPGTLKLLYEDIISRLRKEGKKELAFGFAPFFNVRDHRFKRYIHWMRWTALYLFHCANNV
jgi:hypothetical protein